MEGAFLQTKLVDGSVGESAKRMMRLQRSHQHACINEHALSPVRVNAFAADGLIG